MSSEGRKQNRKTTARKHLINTLSMKHNGEFSITRRHTMCYSDRDRIPQVRSSMDTSFREQRSFQANCNGYRGTRTSSDRFRSPGSIGTLLQNKKTGKVCTFPSIINDLNTFIHSGARQNGAGESSFDTLSDHNPQHKDVFKSSEWSKPNCKERQLQPTTHWAKYRPLTPNLMKTLNKARLPSKIQTERWVQQLPTVNRWRYSSTSNLADQNEDEFEEQKSPYTYRTWIFDGAKKRVTGYDFLNTG